MQQMKRHDMSLSILGSSPNWVMTKCKNIIFGAVSAPPVQRAKYYSSPFRITQLGDAKGRALELNPSLAIAASVRSLVSSLGHMKKKSEATREIEGLLKISPRDNLKLVATRLPSVHKDRSNQFVEGLRKAGLPDC